MTIILFSLLSFLNSFAAISEKCSATYDNLGIPHLRTTSLQDYYYCFGFHHGKDRAWEMDYFRRVALGKNAEIYGYSALKSDLMMRLLNLELLAKRLYKELPEENKVWLKSYSMGVNAGFVEGKKSKEFLDLDYEPQKWKPEHSILVLTLQSFDQTRKTFVRDFEEEKLKEHWKLKTKALFNEDDIPWQNTILKEGEYQKQTPSKKTSYHKSYFPKLWGDFPEVFGRESGSNNWVVKKSGSKNGYAMLANDPHLDLKTPLFWYWINFQTPEFHIVGASVPGVPVVVSGTNGKVAWGITNAYINTADAVFVKDFPKSELVSFRPTVKFKFGFFTLPFFFKSFEKTKDGQIILPLELENTDRMVLRWTGFNLVGNDLAPMFNLFSAKNVTDMDGLLKRVELPAWNFVFADRAGDIGFRVVGKVLKSLEKNSYGITYEKVEDINQVDFLSPMERPHLLKPNRKYIYTANNRHWPVDSKFYGGRGYSYSFRGFRIDELLRDKQHDLESFQNIQCDRQAVDARFFVTKILKIINVPEFNGWNFAASDVSTAQPIYRRLMDLLLEGWQINEYGLYHLLDNLDEKQIEDMKSFYKIARDQINGRSWKEVLRLDFAHMSKNENWKFSPEISGIGDNHSVDPGSSKWNPDTKKYEQFSGASMRMIIIMKDTPEVHLALPGYNRNYSETQASVPAWNEWRDCKYSKISY